ncbi:hypothetical protein [Hymenobacter cellulosivorans]|uniref:CHRD domain-containing protein n=1 Tax=Hymenobacter cellulosivorans TaxID=2932249 RepID=A0ABY4F7B7_9BACT|nr:hypothetical protein [Hymenobacter cellulosivorans]UOQ52567.1 hypothetical protein MUN80_22800 [Hymenobacter cellulosivorans]
MTTRFFATFLLAAALLSSCEDETVTPTTTTTDTESSITVNVSENGAAPYLLKSAQVVSANYKSAATSLTLSGKLSNGQSIRLEFSRTPSSTAPANSTNELRAVLGSTVGTDATGTTSYDAQKKQASGSFSATFPTIGPITGSFAGVPVP